ncbi:MAG: hypothetical protein IJJ26_09335 [Victivallales bacterium]|nr:hypothetical protein [Victivallales bacterium]
MRVEDFEQGCEREVVNDQELHFVEVKRGGPLSVYGLPFWEQEEEFCRLPVGALPQQSKGVQGLAWHTSGVKVRFRSDTRALAVRVKLRGHSYYPHMPMTTISGFDLYMGQGCAQQFVGVTRTPENTLAYTYPLFNWTTSESQPCYPKWDPLDASGLRQFTMNFPLYNGVEKVEVGFMPGSRLEVPAPFTVPDPILFYGSSITQGACASRPGNAYFQILGRRLDANVIGYGFAGNCRAEPVMLDVINSIPAPLAAFVFDYDHNAKNSEFLQETHQPFFRGFRQKHPDTPVIFMSKPDTDRAPEDTEKRRNIILKTFLDARAEGDQNVYFVDGKLFMGTYDRDVSTMDGTHPTDIGFLHMADAVEDTLRLALARKRVYHN